MNFPLNPRDLKENSWTPLGDSDALRRPLSTAIGSRTSQHLPSSGSPTWTR